MTSGALALERAAAPIDRLRRLLLQQALRIPSLSEWLVRRDRRITLLAVGHALVAFTLAATFPMLLFVLGPVLLGVLHVAADVRYLVLRRALPAWWKHVVWIACASLIAFRIFQETGARGIVLARAEHAFVCVWILLGLIAGAVKRHSERRAARATGTNPWDELVPSGGRAFLALPVLGALAWFSWVEPGWTRLVFVHLHNLIAVGLWLWLFRSSRRAALIPLAVIFGAAAVLFFAHPWQLTESVGGLSAMGLHFAVAAEWVAPGFRWEHSYGLLYSYVFLQSVHYSAWLLLIPQDDVAREAPTPFRTSVRSAFADFGPLGIALVSMAALAVVAAAFFGATRARNVYLSLSMFHSYLELTIAAYFFAWGGKALAGRRESSKSALAAPA